ncbi:class I SAM-dependent methyltransferase [Bacillus sp. 2205SS5-2]|uniref:class I SAM-dependent methyltransferase n=1 Tax=Bacillus sp. 2205SS5-2 TaxID=3109031 RepID=UPI003004A663
MKNNYLDVLAYFGIGGAHPGGFELTKSILSNIKILDSFCVLDVGCGTGQTATYLHEEFGCNVTAIDLHPLMVEKAKKRVKPLKQKVKVLEENVQELSFCSETFDFALAESTLSFTDFSASIHELYRVLKTDSTLIILEMTAEKVIPPSIKQKISQLYGINEVLMEEEWRQQLQLAGFKNIRKLSTPSGLIPTDLIDMIPSENIDDKLYDVWDEHALLVQETQEFLGYRIFTCTK